MRSLCFERSYFFWFMAKEYRSLLFFILCVFISSFMEDSKYYIVLIYLYIIFIGLYSVYKKSVLYPKFQSNNKRFFLKMEPDIQGRKTEGKMLVVYILIEMGLVGLSFHYLVDDSIMFIQIILLIVILEGILSTFFNYSFTELVIEGKEIKVCSDAKEIHHIDDLTAFDLSSSQLVLHNVSESVELDALHISDLGIVSLRNELDKIIILVERNIQQKATVKQNWNRLFGKVKSMI